MPKQAHSIVIDSNISSSLMIYLAYCQRHYCRTRYCGGVYCRRKVHTLCTIHGRHKWNLWSAEAQRERQFYTDCYLICRAVLQKSPQRMRTALNVTLCENHVIFATHRDGSIHKVSAQEPKIPKPSEFVKLERDLQIVSCKRCKTLKAHNSQCTFATLLVYGHRQARQDCTAVTFSTWPYQWRSTFTLLYFLFLSFQIKSKYFLQTVFSIPKAQWRNVATLV